MKKILFTIIIIFTYLGAYSQKVGVVLSGGGAKGMYHIGILKALENNDIPIDYIGGTSIGSIVGGMYAAGYSPEQIEAIFLSKEVSYWVMGNTDPVYHNYFSILNTTPDMFNVNIDIDKMVRRSKEFKRSEESSGYKKDNNFLGSAIDMVLAKGSNSSAPSLVNSTPLNLGLTEYLGAEGASVNGQFDELFVPFFCVAADIIKKQQYVWTSGDLPLAVRSSMAIPIVYSPVVIDGMVLIDGGVYNNLPWKEMDETYSPDIIISARCVSEETPDVSSIAGQIMMVMTQNTDYDMPSEKGIMIGRSVDVGMLDFSKVAEIAQQGYDDAMLAMPEIKERIARRVSIKDVYNKRLEYKKKTPSLYFSEEDINRALSNRADSTYSKILENNDRNDGQDVYTFNEFKELFYRSLAPDNAFSDFPFVKYNKGSGLFDINLKRTTMPSLHFKGGVNVSSATINQAYLGLTYLSKDNSLYTSDIFLGSFYSAIKFGMRKNFYNRKNPFYLYTTSVYNFYNMGKANNQRFIYRNEEGSLLMYKVNDFYVNSTVGVPVGSNQKLEFSLAVGYDWLNYHFTNEFTSDDVPDMTKIPFTNALMRLSRNNLNYRYYPTAGLHQEVSISGTYGYEVFKAGTAPPFSDADYSIKTHRLWLGARFMRDDYIKVSKHFTFGYLLQAELTTLVKPIGTGLDDMVYSQSFKWAAPYFAPTEYSKTLFLSEFQNPSYVAVGIKPIVNINEKFYVKLEGYLYHGSIIDYNDFLKDIKFLGAASIVYQSPIGPLSLSYNYFGVNSIKSSHFLFNIGVMIMNDKGIRY